MTKSEIYTFVTSLLNEIQIDVTLFTSLLDNAQMRIEGMRPWVILRGSDVSQTANVGDDFTTSKTLAADFREWYDEAPIQLISAQNTSLPLVEVPYADRYVYKSSGGRFCVDYANNRFYLLTTVQQPYTILQNYIKLSTLVSSADSATWVFPERFHKILGLMVAEMWKNGIDYDVISNSQATQQSAQAAAILNEMTRWDSRLQLNMTRGIDQSQNLNTFNTGLMNGTNIF